MKLQTRGKTGCANLLPHQTERRDEHRPNPLHSSATTVRNSYPAAEELHSGGLADHSPNPDHEEERVREKPFEYIDLPKELAAVDLVEELHENEHVEDERVML